MQISGADYGPAVPSGVSVVRRDREPRPRDRIPSSTPRRSAPPTPDRPAFRLAPVRPRGPVAAARRAGHRQGRDGQPDPLVQGPRDVGRRPPPGRGGEDRPRPADRRGVGRQLRAGRRLRGARRSASRPSCSRRCNANPGKVDADARARRDGPRGRGRTSTRPSPRSEAYAAEHAGRAARRRRRSGISTGAATMALEVTDAVAAGHLPAVAAAFVPVGNGALINGVGSWLGT